MPTISVHAPELSGETGLTLWLRTNSGALLNTGGDSLTESPAASGFFSADVAEQITETVHARIHDASGVVRDGWISQGETLIIDRFPVVVSGGGGGGGSGDALEETSQEILAAVSLANQRLNAVQAKTALISAGRIRTVNRVAENELTAKAGDDHLILTESALWLPIDDETGAVYTFLTDPANQRIEFGAARAGRADEITGTITASEIYRDAGQTMIPIEIVASATAAKPPERYEFDIQVITAAGYRVTRPDLTGVLTLEPDFKT